MLDASTIYLLLAMFSFVFVAIAMVNQHGNNDMIRKKRAIVKGFTDKTKMKIDNIEKEIIDLKIKIDDLEDEINSVHVQTQGTEQAPQ